MVLCLFLDTGDVPLGRTSREGHCIHYLSEGMVSIFTIIMNFHVKRPISINWYEVANALSTNCIALSIGHLRTDTRFRRGHTSGIVLAQK